MSETALTFDDVLIEPGLNTVRSRKDVDLSVKCGDYINLRLPIISSNMDTITGPDMCIAMKTLGGMGILHRFNTIEQNVNDFREVIDHSGNSNVGCSLGVNEEFKRAEALYHAGCRIFCVDVAHGHSDYVGKFTHELKKEFPDITLIAGNVVTDRGTRFLTASGVDIVKVGIGPGSVCSTRIKTGCGVPQITAIENCSKEATTIADGGIRSPGDIAKALSAGADFVMLGGMIAGADETPGELWLGYKSFRGNASREINEDKLGGMPEWKTAEGVSVKVKYKGPLKNIIQDIEGGLRSAFTYVGARTLHEFQLMANLIRISPAGYIEGTPHVKG